MLYILISLVAVWRDDNGVGRINEVTVRRAWLVLGWVTRSPRYVTSHSGQLSLLRLAGTEMSTRHSEVKHYGWGLKAVICHSVCR